MSSTARGGRRSEADFYATPPFCVERLLEAVDLPAGLWLEPAGGDGAIIRECLRLRPAGVAFDAAELRPECAPVLKPLVQALACPADFLFPAPVAGRYVVAITNPPFRLAWEFYEKMRGMADYTVLLLRLNFLGSELRSERWRSDCPDVYVLPNRPSFRSPDAVSGQGKWQTDSVEYAWFVWGPERTKKGALRVLAATSLAERKRK